jgi:hypothetical protein
MIELNPLYDNDKSKEYIEYMFGKNIDDLNLDEVIVKCAGMYALLIEMIDLKDKDTNFEVMRLQTFFKYHFGKVNE